MAEVSIHNDFVELSVDSESGAISQVTSRKTSIKYLKSASNSTLYVWVLQTGKKSKHHANDDEPYRILTANRNTLHKVKRVDSQEGSILEVAHDVDGVGTVARYRLAGNSQLIYCDIKVTNNRPYEFSNDVVAVGFPQLQSVRVGDRIDDDVLVRPNRFGEKIKDPAGRCGTFPPTLLYGGFASMMWMDIYDRDGGLYFASYDRSLLLTALESWPDRISGSVALGMRKYVYVPLGRSWVSEPFVIGVHDGDWHWAADRYREWAESWMVKPNIPEDIRQMDGWYGVNLKAGGTFERKFRDLERFYDDAEYIGLKHVQFWGEMVGEGCCYRFYYPDPRLGTIEDLKSAISAIKKRGGRVGFYFNIQAFSPNIKEFLAKRGIAVPADVKLPDWSEFRSFAQTNFDGSLTVQYPGREFESDGFRIMCTYSKGWQDYLTHWSADKYVGEYGANFSYIDQVFSPTVSYCFNFDHGHEHHGASAQGRVNLIERIYEQGRAHDPNFAMCIEGNGDSVGQFSQLHLYTSFSSQTRYPAPEVFAYTFPDYIILDGFANPPVDWIAKCYYPDMPGDADQDDLMNRVYLLGFRFDVTLPDGSNRESPLASHIKKLVNLRKKIKHIQYNSRFLDELGVRRHPERTAAKLFKSLDGRTLLVNVIDYGKAKRSITIELDLEALGIRGPFSAVLYSLDGQVRKVEAKCVGDALSLSLPPIEGKVASIVVGREG